MSDTMYKLSVDRGRCYITHCLIDDISRHVHDFPAALWHLHHKGWIANLTRNHYNATAVKAYHCNDVPKWTTELRSLIAWMMIMVYSLRCKTQQLSSKNYFIGSRSVFWIFTAKNPLGTSIWTYKTFRKIMIIVSFSVF